MKTKIITLSILIASGAFFLIGNNDAHSKQNGAPVGKTGSPGDGSNCTSCHTSVATTIPSLISSNIPAAGYTPGATYQITATIAHNTFNEFGFQISPQSPTGTQLGTLTATNTTETQTLAMGKYITHKTAGTPGTNNSKTWTFDWTAPVQGTGNVTFYGAFVCANNNGSETGDQVVLSTTSVSENATTSVSETNTIPSLLLYPNPANESVVIDNSLLTGKRVNVEIYNINGALVFSEDVISFPSKYTVNTSGLEKGVYFVNVLTAEGKTVRRLVKN
ncbi:MAG: hypothetical protein Fur0041_22100 [Bacteroidia bacterium]